MDVDNYKPFCGPDGTPTFISRILSIGHNASCETHDIDYGDLGIGRKESDEKFRDNMRKESGRNPFMRFWGWLKFKAVRAFGEGSWERAQKISRNAIIDKSLDSVVNNEELV